MKMLLMVTTVLTILGTASSAHALEYEISYDEILAEAIENCPYAREQNIVPAILWQLLEIEREAGVPKELRGMILAAACKESGYNAKAMGDRKFSKDKKTPMAVGIMQLWPYFEKRYGVDRTNAKEAAAVWMKHITKQIPKIKKQCKYKKDSKVWLAAWVTGIRYKKPGGRCKERPTHYRLLKRWHRNIKKAKKLEREEYMPSLRAVKKGNGC